jgi:phosphonoacetate hydrolase
MRSCRGDPSRLSRGAVPTHAQPHRRSGGLAGPDIDTVFGDLPAEAENLEAGYRSHGSLYEMEVPLVYFDPAGDYPHPGRIDHNLDLTRSLFAPAAD